MTEQPEQDQERQVVGCETGEDFYDRVENQIEHERNASAVAIRK